MKSTYFFLALAVLLVVASALPIDDEEDLESDEIEADPGYIGGYKGGYGYGGKYGGGYRAGYGRGGRYGGGYGRGRYGKGRGYGYGRKGIYY